MANDLGGRRQVLTSNRWSIAALVCLIVGAVLLFVAWYDVSGTANVYEQLPYLVSAGFSGLALVIVGSALLIAGREDRIERRLVKLADALTDAIEQGPAPSVSPSAGTSGPAAGEADNDPLAAVAGGTTYHRATCLLLRGKETDALSDAEAAARDLKPCPVCGPRPVA